eukprot:15432297-Alexandrium_andersonii.AAC.1
MLPPFVGRPCCMSVRALPSHARAGRPSQGPLVVTMVDGPCSCGNGHYSKGVCSANCGNPEGPARRAHRLKR